MSRSKFYNKFLDDQSMHDLVSDIPIKERTSFFRFLRKATEDELEKPPKIALIGRTGVGKSSTLNALFGTNLPVHDTIPSTREPEKIMVDYATADGTWGTLQFYDMPGVGESIKADKDHLKTYKDVLSRCDLAVWVLEGDNRALTFDEKFIKDFVDNKNKKLVDRLVIAINKVDHIEPGNWIKKYNIPSIAQEKNMNDRVLYVQKIFGRAFPGLPKDRIVAYSAKHNYRLGDLFESMLKACPQKRAWVLNSIKDIADYADKVDEKVKEKLLASGHLSIRGRHESVR